MTSVQALRERSIIGVIGDEDTVTGILLAGVGHIDNRQKTNFMVVDGKTPLQTLQDTFVEFCMRKDMAVLLINQHVANEIRESLEEQQAARPFPVILEIPSKEHPYDPAQDSVLKRVQLLFGNE